jgi:sugar phosphate isomerase/epimerase
MSILLTLSAGPWWLRPREDGSEPSLLELPQFAIRELELRGLNLQASMLAGWTLEELDRLRDRADKAGCPCLVLVEDQPLGLGDEDPAVRNAARDRVGRLAVAANRLGCNALALRCDGPDDDEFLDRVAETVRATMPAVERMELNLLVTPGRGLTETPDRLTELIKRIGGFRIGSLPTFLHAASTGDPVETLRKLAPYAGAVHASVAGFARGGAHKGYDLRELVFAIRSVGFVNTLAIDYAGEGDAVEDIDKARRILQEAIDAEEAIDAQQDK